MFPKCMHIIGYIRTSFLLQNNTPFMYIHTCLSAHQFTDIWGCFCFSGYDKYFCYEMCTGVGRAICFHFLSITFMWVKWVSEQKETWEKKKGLPPGQERNKTNYQHLRLERRQLLGARIQVQIFKTMSNMTLSNSASEDWTYSHNNRFKP